MQVRFQHSWVRHGTGFNDHDKPGRWTVYPDTDGTSELWSFLTVDLEYHRDRMAACLEFLEQRERGVQGKRDDLEPGVVDSGNDGALYYGNGHVLIASDYADDSRVVMTAEQFMVVLRHVLKTMDHPDYRNPDAETPFEPLTVDIIAEGEDVLGEYYKRGGITPIIPEEYR